MRERGEWIDAWAAGVVDSDGCITIKRRRGSRGEVYYALFIVVAQAGDDLPAVIGLLRETYGGSVQHRADPRRPDRLTMWHWSVATRTAEQTLVRIYPYLVGKRDQALTALEYRRHAIGNGKRDIAEQYYWRLRGMKHYVRAKPEEVPA